MTSKQNVVFRYVTRLMLHIPNATIHTLRDLMEPGGAAKYQEEIGSLDQTARRFFATEFDGKEFSSTKSQVLRRLYGVLENRTFERMFSHPKSRFDMFTEMNAGKLILINTAKSLLKEQGTEVFGRFFIALIAQAAQERATLPAFDRLPCMVYVDEAQDYFDENVGIILSPEVSRGDDAGASISWSVIFRPARRRGSQYVGQTGRRSLARDAEYNGRTDGGRWRHDCPPTQGHFCYIHSRPDAARGTNLLSVLCAGEDGQDHTRRTSRHLGIQPPHLCRRD